jgi:phospholipid/cholesterol/gamma-HCH transport system substrate-binding protein
MKSAANVGFLVLVFVALIVGAYATLGRTIWAPRTVDFVAEFSDAGGVATGAAVLLSGVKVGEVVAVRLDGPRRARVTLRLREGTPVQVGTVASMPSSLIGIGDRQVELLPPSGDGALLPPGSTILGVKRSPLASLMPESEETLAELNKTLRATQALLSDEKLRTRLEGVMAAGEDTAKQFGTLATRLDRLLAQNSSQLTQALRQGGRVMDDMAVVSGELARFTKEGQVQERVLKLLDGLEQSVQAGRQLVAEMNALVTDPKLREPMEEIFANTKTMTESGTRVAQDAEKMAKNGVTLSERAIEIADKASALADDVKAILDRFKGVIDKLPGVEQGIRGITAEADLFRESSPGRWRNDMTVHVPYREKEISIGLWDAFESNKVTLQIGQPFGRDATVRYGVFASKPGVGVDYRIAPRLFFRSDLFGVNEPRLDLRARYEFGGGVIGWLGWDRVFEKNAPTIGIGIRR